MSSKITANRSLHPVPRALVYSFSKLPQVLAVLEAMGGTLKADDAEVAYKQEKKAKLARSAADLVRVTAMFSATMPPAVEKMAKKYLRHPAVVQVCVRVCVCVEEVSSGVVPHVASGARERLQSKR